MKSLNGEKQSEMRLHANKFAIRRFLKIYTTSSSWEAVQFPGKQKSESKCSGHCWKLNEKCVSLGSASADDMTRELCG